MATALSELAYKYITGNILVSKLSAGQKVSEEKLAAELGISRTPVREAIRRLQSEGILHQVASSGTYVIQPDRKQLIDTYEVRLALECFSVANAIQRITREERERLQQYCDQMHDVVEEMRDKDLPVLEGSLFKRFSSADMAFHLLLMQAAGNQMAIRIVTGAHIRNRVYGNHTHQRNLHHVAWVWLHHARVAAAIRRNDVASAQRWLSTHIRHSMEDALAAFDEAAARLSDARSGLASINDLIEGLCGEEAQKGSDNPPINRITRKKTGKK